MHSDITTEAWYVISNIETIDSPALVVYLDRVKKNIALAKEIAGDAERLRPHVKTHKSGQAAKLLLHEGLKKFKCATIAEAEMLAAVHAPDVLLAYQPVGPKVQRFLSLIKTYPGTKFSCLIDNLTTAKQLAEEAHEAGVVVDVYIDLNVGMNRTGVLPNQKAFDLYAFCAAQKTVNPAGLHAYDGHINDTDFDIRREKCNAAFEPVFQLANTLQQAGFEAPVIVAGGSATFPIHAARNGVECSPGTFLYWDAGYSRTLPDLPFLPAALVITRVVSLPGAGIICADLGHKAVAAESELSKRVQFLNAPDLKIRSQSEEHLVLEAGEKHSFQIGDVLYGVPYHICPTCALYERAVVIENNTAVGQWKIEARDRTLSC